MVFGWSSLNVFSKQEIHRLCKGFLPVCQFPKLVFSLMHVLNIKITLKISEFSLHITHHIVKKRLAINKHIGKDKWSKQAEKKFKLNYNEGTVKKAKTKKQKHSLQLVCLRQIVNDRTNVCSHLIGRYKFAITLILTTLHIIFFSW